MPPPSKRSVRFNESKSEEPPQKRSRPEHSEETVASVLRPSSHKVRTKNRDRVNEDELDDVDDWNDQEDGDHDDDDGLPSQSQLIEAKRKRREKRGGLLNEDDEHMDEAETSLATDGIKIEPFHMREEETDGTGYFDGDTYVFRKNTPGEDGEADAWADTLMRKGNGDDSEGDGPKISIATNIAKKKDESKSNLQENLDNLSEEQLYERILPLMGDAMESIMEAIRRYGKLTKRKSTAKNRRNKNQWNKQETNDNGASIDVAKSHLDDLTGAASALLLKGEVDIYDKTKQDILRMFPSLPVKHDKNDSGDSEIQSLSKPNWEYQGNSDNQLHGPYTTEQMIAWVRNGYFTGAQRVKIRTICTQEKVEEAKVETQLSTEDDLMADLMDDEDENDEEENRPSKKAKDAQSTSVIIKGQWMWSNEINYQKYL